MYNAPVIIFKSQTVIYILTDVTTNQRNKEIKVSVKRPIIYGKIKLPFRYFLRTSETPGETVGIPTSCHLRVQHFQRMWPGNWGVEWLTQKVLYNQGVILQHLPTTVLHGVFYTKLAFQFIHYYPSSIFVPLFPTYEAN